jgi:DNA repair exonuclease SbcCD ATPase subunit
MHLSADDDHSSTNLPDMAIEKSRFSQIECSPSRLRHASPSSSSSSSSSSLALDSFPTKSARQQQLQHERRVRTCVDRLSKRLAALQSHQSLLRSQRQSDLEDMNQKLEMASQTFQLQLNEALTTQKSELEQAAAIAMAEIKQQHAEALNQLTESHSADQAKAEIRLTEMSAQAEQQLQRFKEQAEREQVAMQAQWQQEVADLNEVCKVILDFIFINNLCQSKSSSGSDNRDKFFGLGVCLGSVCSKAIAHRAMRRAC